LAVCLLTSARAQTQWAKYDSNPVFVKWGLMEAYAIGQPTNLYENDTFKMWYAACAFDHRGRMYLASSLDGIHWTRANLGLPVLDIGLPGSWDQKWLDTPEVLHDHTGYRMFYFGDTTDQPPPIGGLSSALGLATSVNGRAWSKDSANPVFRKDTTLPWQSLWVESPAVLFVHDTLRMWYSAVSYEAGDLLALLELQLQIEQVDLAHAANVAAEQVRHFNKVLAEQLRELEAEIDDRQLAFCASYGMLAERRLDPAQLGLVLKDEVRDLAAAQAQLQRDRRLFKGDAAQVKRLLKQWRAMQRAADLDDLPF